MLHMIDLGINSCPCLYDFSQGLSGFRSFIISNAKLTQFSLEEQLLSHSVKIVLVY